jgi:dephospho-CoA kinase
VGLTGGIACGKTQVVRRLREAGLFALDLDGVAHDLLAPGGAAHPEVVAAFGTGILDAAGAIDRRKLGALVFADGAARARLNALVHPRVRAEEARRTSALAESGAPLVVTDAALLVESGLHLRFDRLVVVHCAPAEQRARLMRRDGLAEAEAEARLAAQMPIEDKKRFAHLPLDTSGSLEETDARSRELAAALVRLATAAPSPRGFDPERGQAVLAAAPPCGPRGLDPGTVLAWEREGPDLGALALRLDPPKKGPWYAADAWEGEPGPEAVAGPLALWCLSRRGCDPEFAALAAASLGRLCHGRTEAWADAVVHTLAALHEVAEGVPAHPRLAEFAALARRFTGAFPTGRALPSLSSAPPAGKAGADPAVEALLRRLAAGN